MTGAEKVLEWMKKYYEVNGTPNYGEIIAQLEMAIEEEKQGQSLPLDVVSQQRELLIAYHKHNTMIRNEELNKFIENYVDDYLSNL